MITDGGPGESERLRIEFEDRILPALERAMGKRFGPRASHDTIVSGAWSALWRGAGWGLDPRSRRSVLGPASSCLLQDL